MPGGVCDMTLLDRYHQKESWGGPPTIGEMTHVINDSVFDQNINSKDGLYDFNHELGIKNIEFIDGIPYCYHENLNKKVKEKNLENNIKFLGNVNNYQKKFLFEKSSLMIMPTLDESHKRSIEGFGIAYIEAAFFAVPSVASNIGGTPEAVINNSTGKIIDNIDELYSTTRELLLDQNLLSYLGRNAKERAIKYYNWAYISNKYIVLINNIIKK